MAKYSTSLLQLNESPIGWLLSNAWSYAAESFNVFRDDSLVGAPFFFHFLDYPVMMLFPAFSSSANVFVQM